MRILSLVLVTVFSVTAMAQMGSVGTNYALDFDGVDDWARVPHRPSLDGFTDFTVEFWVRTTSSQYTAMVFKAVANNGTASDDPYSIGMSYPGQTPGAIFVGINGILTLASCGTVNDGVWHHVAVVGSTASSTVDLFIDGAHDCSASYGGTMVAAAVPLTFGATVDASGAAIAGLHFCGQLDNIRIWDIARLPSEIAANREKTVPGNSVGLVGSWRLDDAPFQVIADSSLGANDGYRGDSATIAGDDPVWCGDAAPIAYCSAFGTGQANSAHARLEVNGAGTGTDLGPFIVGVASGGNLALDWKGPPNRPFALIAGPLHPGGSMISGLGSLDVGTPPLHGDIVVVFDGSLGAGFSTDAIGTANQTAALPALLPGTLISMQGIMFQSPGSSTFGVVLTAAFRIDVL